MLEKKNSSIVKLNGKKGSILMKFYEDNKKLIHIVIGVLIFLAFFGTFGTIYDYGKDFGRSLYLFFT